ncbi:MAG: chaperone of endosialidase [Bacteriophage sp.]|nr:MAG: chaperone of endosialidase [Bacteriophage sp.]
MADQNLKQIQFKRTSTENKAPGADIVARGEIALNTHGRTLAIYTKDEADNVVQLAGKGVPFLDTAGNLNVDGTTTLKDNVTISPNKAINFEATDLSGAIVRHIVGKCATNDGWYIGAGGTSNSGILEIGTIDDGAETIQFVQRGAGNVEARKLVLLDGSGNTTLPGDLRLSTNKTVKINNGSTLVLEMGVGSNDAYIKNQRGVGVLQLTNDSNLTFRNSQVYYAMNGRGPGKSGTLLTNVENNRQAWQYVISAATAGTPRWVKVATIKHPGDASSQLDLMITGGIDSGQGRHYVDFITLSGRNLTSWSTNNLDNWVEWRRIGSPNKGNVPEYYVVKNDAATDSEASFDFYAKLPRYASGIYVTVLNTAGYNGQDSGKVIIYETGQDTGDTGPTGSILVSMKQIFDSYAKPDFGDTTGTLPVNRGGTGATNAGDARNNLGLGTAAVRDVGESSGNVMEVGAFGLGGNGKSIVDITSDVDLMTRLKALGGTVFRANTASGYTGAPYYSHGTGFYGRASDTMSALNIDYATGIVRVFATNDSGLASGKVNSNVLYGTANKPSKDDVGLGNLTNDTQVKKAGDTMTGDLAAPNLHASGPGTASVYVNAGSGNAHVWFRTNANERGVIWATPNTTDLGQINIRAKTTEGVSAGDFSFRSDGRFDVPVAVKVGGAAMLTKDGNITSGSLFGGNLNNYLNTIKNDIVAGDNKQVSKTGDTMTGNLTINANLKVENPNGSMVDLGSENSDKYSRLTLARKVGSGAAVAMLKITPEGYVQFGYQDAVATTAPSKYLLVKSNGLEVEGDLVFNQTYRGTEEAVDITDKTNDLNNMVIKGSDLGTRQLYKCVSSGGGSKIANKPTSDGNFVLEVLSLRKISDSDWTCKQTFTTKGGSVEGTYVRYCQNGSWSAWKEVVAGVQPINLGGTGATSVAAARNNLGVGEGQTVKFGGLNVTGKMTAGGEFEAQNSKITGNLNVSEDNRMIVLGKNSDIGLVKKSNMPGKMAIGKSNSFTVMVSTNTNNQINPADTFSDIFKVDASGNQTVYGNAQINRQLTVTSNTNLNSDLIVKGNSRFSGVINADGNINVASGKFVIAGQAPTNNSHLTNKKYVDDKVASAISNAGDTYLPLAGGTVTGRLTITGDQLKTTSLWVTGDAAINGVLTIDGKARFNQEFSVSTSVNVQNDGNSHVFFRKANGAEKGLIWADDPGNVSIRTAGASGPVWNFWNSGSCQFPGAISNYNGINSTTNYPGGKKNDYLNTAGLVTRFSNGAYASLYFQEYVENYHQAILNVNGYGQDNSFYFRAGGDFICTRNGSFDNVEIRSDRRAKSDIKVIENALEKVETLSGNTYELHNTSGGTTRSAGLIAQEVQEVLPEAVTQDNEEDGGMLRLNYNSVIALLVESVKELSAEVKELKAEIEELKSK